MGGGENGVGTLSSGDASHLDGLIPRACAVVQSGEEMAVNVDQRVGACHAVTWEQIVWRQLRRISGAEYIG